MAATHKNSQHQLQSACACLPPFRGSDCYIVDQGERDKERPFRGALVYVPDRRSETLEAFLTNLRKLNALAGWEYPLIIFTADVLLQEKEKIILASENRVWFVQSQEANIAGSGMLQWFRHTHLFDHPGIAGLDILWDVTDADIVFKEDPLRNLQTKRAQAGCRRIEDVSARSGLRASQDAFLGDLTELFVQLSQATLAEGVHGAASACTVWKRTFMSEPLFRQYIQFLEDAVGGATEAALRFDALSVRNFGIELLHRQVRGTQLLYRDSVEQTLGDALGPGGLACHGERPRTTTAKHTGTHRGRRCQARGPGNGCVHGHGTGRDVRDKQQAGDICMAGRLVKGMQVEAGETDEAGEEAAGQVLDSWLAREKGPAVVNFILLLFLHNFSA
ncbi:hypothetical protein AK812_SmicGene17569 [Symbiodinium microadriaticum]|uniref:Uncharacterized protein n=1 Tax=Symbiodinium microadriaticum TaxID=2951 RepID=A0A1Q9DXC7_SYMMI|nr:hypothetical protein AK812_SmicGene17569 [Symbiodinium microadriaticum]